MADARPALDAFDRAFGVQHVVTPAGGVPVTMTVIADPRAPATLVVEGEAAISDRRPVFAVRRDLMPSLPEGSTLVGPRVKGGAVRTWHVDRVDDTDPEYLYAVVSG